MKIIIIILALLVIALSGYGLFNPESDVTSITIPLLGVLLLVMGGEQLKAGQKAIGYLLVIVGLFNIFVAIQGFFLN